MQFIPGLDHAHASMRDDNSYAEESQEVYFTSAGQTILQDLGSSGDLPVTTTDRDRRSGIQPTYSWLPVWLKNSPTVVKATTAVAALLVVIFIAIMASGIANLSKDQTPKFNSSANTGTDYETTDAPFPLPTKEPTTVITSSPVASAQVPATTPPSTPPPTTPPPSSEAVVPIPTTLAPTQSEPTEQPTPFPDLICPKDLINFVTIDQSAVLYYDIVLTESGDDGIMCGRLQVLNHKGWVGVAISLDGMMIGSDAIIGEPSTNSVLKYSLNGKGADLVNTMDEAKQTLKDTSIIEDKGSIIMTFTKRLVESGGIPITPRGKNTFLHARGDDTTIGYHSTKGTFVLDLTITNPPISQPTEGPSTSQPTVVPALADSTMTCTEYSPCNQCLGSCDSDFDCAGGLQCFRRSYGEPVPGCSGEGNYRQNYCYNPFANGATVLLTTNAQECDKKAPCGKCFGSCSADEDCDKNLFCYRRFDNPFRLVPGCAGQGESGANYCFDPNDIS
ncbi:hypothetical protein ACHAXM_006775 [Skeletonema potamos]